MRLGHDDVRLPPAAWLSSFLSVVIATLTCTTAAIAAIFTYDVPTATRVEVHEFDDAQPDRRGWSDVPDGSAPAPGLLAAGQTARQSAEPLGASTTSFRSFIATNTASGASRTQLFRSVEPGELADLVGSGQFRTIAGQEGKYFFPTQQQAAAFDDIISGQAAVTSGRIDSSLLSGVEQITISGEGAAWFIPEELLPYIDDIVIHGAP